MSSDQKSQIQTQQKMRSELCGQQQRHHAAGSKSEAERGRDVSAALRPDVEGDIWRQVVDGESGEKGERVRLDAQIEADGDGRERHNTHFIFLREFDFVGHVIDLLVIQTFWIQLLFKVSLSVEQVEAEEATKCQDSSGNSKRSRQSVCEHVIWRFFWIEFDVECVIEWWFGDGAVVARVEEGFGEQRREDGGDGVGKVLKRGLE